MPSPRRYIGGKKPWKKTDDNKVSPEQMHLQNATSWSEKLVPITAHIGLTGSCTWPPNGDISWSWQRGRKRLLLLCIAIRHKSKFDKRGMIGRTTSTWQEFIYVLPVSLSNYSCSKWTMHLESAVFMWATHENVGCKIWRDKIKNLAGPDITEEMWIFFFFLKKSQMIETLTLFLHKHTSFNYNFGSKAC